MFVDHRIWIVAALGLGLACKPPPQQPIKEPAAAAAPAPSSKPVDVARPKQDPALPEATPELPNAGKATGTPSPAFEGPLPEDPLVWTRRGAVPGHYGGHLVLPTAGNPKSFNPVVANETSTTALINGPIYTTLVGFDPIAFESEPRVARSYQVSDDGLTYTFQLRRGLRWSDGQPFSADDVLFSFQVVFDPKVLNSARDLFKDSKGRLPSYEKLDDHQVRFRLKEVNVLFVGAVGAIYLIPKHRWAATYRAGNIARAMLLDTPPKDLVSLGPYRVKSFKTDQRLVLERNPYFWATDRWGNRLPYVDKVTFIIVPDHNTSMLKLLSGDVHIYDTVNADQYDLLKRDEAQGGFSVHDLGPALSSSWLTFNTNPNKNAAGRPLISPAKRAIFAQKAFRQAISHAIDRKGIVETALLGRGRPLYCFTSEANRTWHQACTRYPHDVQKANELLDGIGLMDRDGDGVREDREGNRFEISLLTNVENTVRIAAGNVIRSDLARVGLRATLKPVPFNSLVTNLQDTLDWEAVILGWASGVPPDPAMSKNILLSSGRLHVWHPRQKSPATPWEAEIDARIAEMTGTLDLLSRQQAYGRILEILAEQQAQIFTVNANTYVAAKNGIGNFHPTIIRPYGHWNLLELFLPEGSSP